MKGCWIWKLACGVVMLVWEMGWGVVAAAVSEIRMGFGGVW